MIKGHFAPSHCTRPVTLRAKRSLWADPFHLRLRLQPFGNESPESVASGSLAESGFLCGFSGFCGLCAASCPACVAPLPHKARTRPSVMTIVPRQAGHTKAQSGPSRAIELECQASWPDGALRPLHFCKVRPPFSRPNSIATVVARVRQEVAGEKRALLPAELSRSGGRVVRVEWRACRLNGATDSHWPAHMHTAQKWPQRSAKDTSTRLATAAALKPLERPPKRANLSPWTNCSCSRGEQTLAARARLTAKSSHH